MAEGKGAMHILREFSIPLIAGVACAVGFANLAPDFYEHWLHASPFGAGSHFNFHFLVNDIFMVFFFGIAAKEITESVLPGGDLYPIKRAINPIFATIGGVAGPILIYLGWVFISGDASLHRGWAIPTATDIALAWLVARIAFGRSHPAVSFLLLLAIVDDGIGLGIIAIFYPDPHHPVAPIWITLVAAAMALAYGMRARGVNSVLAYLVVPGLMSWCGFFFAHLHPALALVPIIPFLPGPNRDAGLYAEESDGHVHSDTLNRFEHNAKPWVDFGLFGFGLANAGVAFSAVGDATWAVLLGLIVGKTVGIYGFSMLAVRLGFPLPPGIDRVTLVLVGMTAGLGLTVALFVAGVAFTDPGLQSGAKMGALLSGFVAPVVIVASKLLLRSPRLPEVGVRVVPEPIHDRLDQGDLTP